MSDQWQQVADRRDLVCSLLKSGDDPDSRAFIGAGITMQGGEPNLLVFSQDDEATTKAAIKARVGPQAGWVDTIDVMHSQGFKMHSEGFEAPQAGSKRSPLAALGNQVISLLERLRFTLAGVAVGDGMIVTSADGVTPAGTIGCALQDGGAARYYLTARHVTRQVGDPAYLNGGSKHQIGIVRDRSISDLDWSVILADPQAATPISTLSWDNNLALTGPMSSAAVKGLGKQRVAISTQLEGGRNEGTVVSIGTTLKVPQAADQIVVKSDPGTAFGQNGDSGAVAYLANGLGARTAIGLYWFIDQPNDLHLLEPLTNILADIEKQAGLALRLL